MDAFRQVIETHWRKIFHFTFRMTLDARQARDVVEETFLRAYVGEERMPEALLIEAWLFRIANHVLDGKDSGPHVSFDLLDETLRSEATRTDVVQSLSDPQRNFLLWELKQGCMTAVLNCLAPGERVAFTLAVVFAYTDDAAANVLGITTSAFKVRLSRARKKVTDYLAARCEHVDPMNPCHCPSRLGVALKRGFLPSPPNTPVKIRPSFGRYGSGAGEDAPLRDVMAIYQSLPEPDAPEELFRAMTGKLDSGAWAAVRTGLQHSA